MRSFICPVISEPVVVRLRRRYFSAPNTYCIECNQRDCQYADDNRPPCPASLEMFTKEIAARKRAA